MAKKKLEFQIGANTSKFFAALARIQRAVRRLSTTLKTALKPATMLLGAINAISGAALTLGIRRLAAYGAELNHISSASGIAVGKLAVMKQAFLDAGLSEGDLRPTINAMQKFISESIDTLDSPKIKRAWERLKLDPRQLQQVSDPSKQFAILIGQLQQIPDLADRSAVAMQIFRTRGPQLLPINLAALQDAEASLGSLPRRMDKLHGSLERIDTILGRMKIKVHQFFAGFVDANIGKLESVMEGINRMDFAPLGERLARMLEHVFSSARQLIRLLFEGNLWKFLKHKILGLAHMIGHAISTALQSALKNISIRTPFGNKPLLSLPDQPSESAAAQSHFAKAAQLFKGARPVSESLTPQNPLYKLATFFKNLTKTPQTRNPRAFAADPNGFNPTPLTPQISAPIVSALQSIGGGGNIGQSSLPSIQQNTARANQLSAEHISISKEILENLTRPVRFGPSPPPTLNF